LIPILRLDQPDPVSAWRRAGKELEERGEKLTGMELESLRFLDDGTDLVIGLNPGALWVGGPVVMADGRWTLPNIPTEEIFTTPDWRRTEGTVRCTRPVKVLETQVTGAWFRFREGRVVEAGAKTGADVLETFLSTDQGARFVGEVALVDDRSPISRSGLTFSSILLDENASCHFALGSGYPENLQNAGELTEDKALKDAGCNVSLVHVDFMMASGETRVIGTDRQGQEKVLMEKGRFVF
jgi:aminopeptidase